MRSGGVLDSDRQSDAGWHAGLSQSLTQCCFQSTCITFIWQETGRFLQTWRKAVHKLTFFSSFRFLCFLDLSDRVLQKQDGVFQDLCFLYSSLRRTLKMRQENLEPSKYNLDNKLKGSIMLRRWTSMAFLHCAQGLAEEDFSGSPDSDSSFLFFVFPPEASIAAESIKTNVSGQVRFHKHKIHMLVYSVRIWDLCKEINIYLSVHCKGLSFSKDFHSRSTPSNVYIQ